MNKTEYSKFFEKKYKKQEISRKLINFNTLSTRKAATKKTTRYLLAYQPDYKKKT